MEKIIGAREKMEENNDSFYVLSSSPIHYEVIS